MRHRAVRNPEREHLPLCGDLLTQSRVWPFDGDLEEPGNLVSEEQCMTRDTHRLSAGAASERQPCFGFQRQVDVQRGRLEEGTHRPRPLGGGVPGRLRFLFVLPFV